MFDEEGNFVGYEKEFKKLMSERDEESRETNEQYIREFAEVLQELEKRQMNTLSLYEPLPYQERYHACNTKVLVMRKGNRVGASLCGFMEDARACLNRDPYKKYDKTGKVVCIGYGEKHIAETIYRYLFEPGAFKIIQDEITGLWRTYRPWTREGEVSDRTGILGDKEREEDTIPAPPMIPREYFDEKPVWVNAGAKVFSKIKLTTGWTVVGANSNGDPSQNQGYICDLVHIDEDIAKHGWFMEQYMRTLDKEGLIRWTAMAQQDNDVLTNLYKWAEEQEDWPEEKREVECIQVSTLDNPFIDREQVARAGRMARLMGDDEYDRRILGLANNKQILVYPRFHARIHDIHETSYDTPAIQMYRDNGNHPPHDWCRYASIDPGRQIAAVVFLAIPPHELGMEHIVYDEIYLPDANAVLLAQEMRKHIKRDIIQAFIIDSHGGKLREIGSGNLPREVYSKEFQKHGVESVETGSRFLDGCDNIEAREEILSFKLSTEYLGDSPGVFVDFQRCPALVQEMTRFRRKRTKTAAGVVISDKADRGKRSHAVECLEYLAAHRCDYVKPSPPKKLSTSELYQRFQDQLERQSGKIHKKGGLEFGSLSMSD